MVGPLVGSLAPPTGRHEIEDAGRVGPGRSRPPTHVLVAMVVATLVVVVLPLATTLRPDMPSVQPNIGDVAVFRPIAGAGPFLTSLVTTPQDRVVVDSIEFEVVGDGRAEARVCEWADGRPGPFAQEPPDAPVVRDACASVEPFEAGDEVGTSTGRSLVLRFEATGPAEPTVCALSATLRTGDPGSGVEVADVPVGVALRDDFTQPPGIYDDCPDRPSP